MHYFCSYPGCGVLVENYRRCDKHRNVNTRIDRRGSAGKSIEKGGRGYDWKWQKCRKAYLQKQPLCERCLQDGKPVAAVLVHHKVEVDKAPELRLVHSNLQSVCASCHQAIHQEMRTHDITDQI